MAEDEVSVLVCPALLYSQVIENDVTISLTADDGTGIICVHVQHTS